MLFACLALALSAKAQVDRIDSLLRIVKQNKRDTVQVKVYSDLAGDFARKDIAKEKAFLYEGIKLSKELNSFFITGLYSLLTTAHQASGAMDSAEYYLGLLKTEADRKPGEKRIVLNYNQTAGLFYKNSGRPKEALPHMIRTIELTQDATSRAGMMLNAGNTYLVLGDLENAADYHLKSLSLFEIVGNKRGQSFAYQGLGNDYLKMEQWKKAEPYFEKSLKLKEELKDTRGTMIALGGLGNVYMELGDYPKAEKTFEKGFEMAKEMSLVSEQGQGMHQLAQLYQRMGDREKSRIFYKRALEFAKQTDDKSWIAWIESNIIELDEEKSKETMEAGLLKSLHQYEEAGDKISIANSHHNLSEFYSQNKNYEKAFLHLKTAKTLDDSTRGQSVDAQLSRLESRYADEKRDREMELLRKNQELKTASLERTHAVQAGVIIALISVLVIGLLLVNRYQVIARSRRLTEIEKVRNAIARDLHDDIGSTLSSINILSQLAIREKNGDSWKHFNKIAEQSGRMMESMSDIVWSISPGNDSLGHVVSKMKEFAAEILEPKNITYRFTGEDSLKDTTLSLDKRKNLFLIFKEAVNNAAKYSGATDLEITFVRNGNTLSLSVSDNGGGFEPETVKAGNGLKNMKARASALRARFDFVSTVKHGTRVALELPLT